MLDETILFCAQQESDGIKKLINCLRDNYHVTLVHSPEEVVNLLEKRHFDLVAFFFDQEPGYKFHFNLITGLLAIDADISLIFFVAEGDIQSMVKVAQTGAFYFLAGASPDIKACLDLVETKMELHRDSLPPDYIENPPFGIVGKSSAIRRILALVNKVKDTDANVIITGESGTGKELIAHALHFGGKRAVRPFEVVNCGAIPGNLMESELFGHVKGAFTGAYQDRKGKFELANGGTLFLDEIGELEMPLQAKLLRVLEDFKVEPVGSSCHVEVDVRIITATNRDLYKMVCEGFFREDLFFRFNVINIHIPALRERKDDIPLLVNYFIKRYKEKYQSLVEGIEAEALKALENYDWPGNIRELQNAIQRLVILSEGKRITLSDLPKEIVKYKNRPSSDVQAYSLVPVYIGDTLEEAEKKLITKTLDFYKGNKSKAAEILGITDRTLRNKLKTYS